MVDLFIAAVILGFLFNAAPGAIFAESLRRGMKGGFYPAFRVQIGSLVGDFTWACLGLLGVAALFQLPMVERPLAFLGAGLLGYLAYGSFKDARAPMPKLDRALAPKANKDNTKTTSNAYSIGADFSVGVGMSLSNPINITYWAGLGGTITALGVTDPTGLAFTVFLSGFMLSSVLWCFICAGFIGATRHMISPRAWIIINSLCGLGLAYFAILVAWRSI